MQLRAPVCVPDAGTAHCVGFVQVFGKRREEASALRSYQVCMRIALVLVALMRKDEIFANRQITSHFSSGSDLPRGQPGGQRDGRLRPYPE